MCSSLVVYIAFVDASLWSGCGFGRERFEERLSVGFVAVVAVVVYVVLVVVVVRVVSFVLLFVLLSRCFLKWSCWL